MAPPLGIGWEIWLSTSLLIIVLGGIVWKGGKWIGVIDQWKKDIDSWKNNIISELGSLNKNIIALNNDISTIRTALQKDATGNGIVKRQSPLVPSEKAIKILDKISLISEVDANYFNIISKVNNKGKLTIYKDIKPEDKFIEITPTIIHELIKIGEINDKKIDNAMKELGETFGAKVASYYGILLLITSYVLEKRRGEGCLEGLTKINKAIDALYCKNITELLNNFDNNLDTAIESYERSIRTLEKIDPKEKTILQCELASLYQYIGKNDEALRLLEDAYKIFIKKSDKEWALRGASFTLASIAQIYSTKGDNDAALEKINEAIKLKSDMPGIYFTLGNIYMDLNQSKKAIENFNKAIKLNPKNFAYYFNLGTLYLFNGEDKKGSENINKALELEPNDPIVYTGLAHVNHHLKQYQEEIMNLTKALELMQIEEQKAVIYHNRGLTYIDLNEYDKALEDFNKSLEISKKLDSEYHELIADTLLHIGRIYGETNKKDKAIENTKEALKLFEKLKMNEGIKRAEKQLELLQKSFS